MDVKDQGVQNADVTHDGNVTSEDVFKVVRYIAGFIDENILAQPGN